MSGTMKEEVRSESSLSLKEVTWRVYLKHIYVTLQEESFELKKILMIGVARTFHPSHDNLVSMQSRTKKKNKNLISHKVVKDKHEKEKKILSWTREAKVP